MSETEPGYWDEYARQFDDEPDHGLRDPEVHDAWRRLLAEHVPPGPCDVVDLGCGTGSLAILLARQGYRVRGLDFSSRMVEIARAKAADSGVEAEFLEGDASTPPYDVGCTDVVLARHVLWALPDRGLALSRWCRLLREPGLLLLVEGRWSTGAGLTAAQCEELVRRERETAAVVPLDDPRLWGRPIEDERYLLVSAR